MHNTEFRFVKKVREVMGKTIRLSESGFDALMRNSVADVVSEDGATAGLGTGAQYDVPFGAVQKRSVYNPKGSKGSKGSSESNISMEDALSRGDGKGGSISMPVYRVGHVKK